MKRIIYVIISSFLFFIPGFTQVLIDDFAVNNSAQNTNGVGRTAVSALPNGTFAVAWQDFNDYNVPVAEIPRVAVQMYAANASPIGPLNLFRGESRSLSIWTSDYLDADIDLNFLPDGTLLVGVEHKGTLSIGGDFVYSEETGIGAVSAAGDIIDLTSGNGVILWLIPLALDNHENTRLAVAPDGAFFAIVNGPTYDTGFSAVAIQQFDANGSFVGDFFFPHSGDPGPNANHVNPDIGTNGSLHMVVWQDGRQDNNYDITAQFYNNSGPIGGNFLINTGDPAGTVNLVPSMAMNTAGNSIVVWYDTRVGSTGEIWGQRFNGSGQTVGNNFQISSGEGFIWDRPEVAMRTDGSFMVVWTDSLASQTGINALRARGRQFDSNGNPTGTTFLLPNQNVASGLANISTDGSAYYCAWLDTRSGSNINVYAKVIGNISTSVDPSSGEVPGDFHLAQNYPNPFNPSTTIDFSLKHSATVELVIYNQLGQIVKTLENAPLTAGVHSRSWNGTDAFNRPVASGIYFYQLRAGEFLQRKKMLLVR